MATQFVTIQLDSTTAETFRALQQKVKAEGLSLETLLQQLIEMLEKKQNDFSKPPLKKVHKERTWADVWAEIDSMPSAKNHPSDLSSNKK